MAVTQKLTVTTVSTNATENTSYIRIMWTSTQTGDSYNDYIKTAYYYISINGGDESEVPVSYTLPKNSTKIIIEGTHKIAHKEDGTATVIVRTWMDTGISAGVVKNYVTYSPTRIVRASTITTAMDKNFGEACSVTWRPLSKEFTYKLTLSIGEWNETTDVIKPGVTVPYTYTDYKIPRTAANQLPNSTEGTMTVSLSTYSDSNGTTQVGSSSSKTFKITVPQNDYFTPSVVMALNADNSLESPFKDLYIQGKSRVKARITAGGKYGAEITKTELSVDGKNNGTLTSDYLIQSGVVNVMARAYDTRGFIGGERETIYVIPYSKPQVRPVSGESAVIAMRCDENGNVSNSGTHLTIKASRYYSLVESDGVQYNHCELRYRYKSASGEYSDWTTILAKDATTDVVGGSALPNVTLDVKQSYYVQIQAIDEIEEGTPTTISIPTESVYLHKAGSKNSLGFGKYVEVDNTVDIESDITVQVRGSLKIGAGLDEIVDFPVEIGTSGIWEYRKWYSGKVECWGRSRATVNISTEWGAIYYGTVAAVDFPSGLFIDAPMCQVTPEYGGTMQIAWNAVGGEATSTSTPSIVFCRPNIAQEVSFDILYYAIGKWK